MVRSIAAVLAGLVVTVVLVMGFTFLASTVLGPLSVLGGGILAARRRAAS